jgi:hypothetical protein
VLRYVLAALLPIALWAGYFGTIAVTTGLAWDAEQWSSTLLLAGIVGLGLQYAMTAMGAGPPIGPGGERATPAEQAGDDAGRRSVPASSAGG